MPKPTQKSRFSAKKKSHPKPQGEYVWIFGKHAVAPVLLNSKRHILEIVVSRNNTDLLNDLLKNHPKREKLSGMVTIGSQELFSKILPEDAVHQGIAIKTLPLPSYAIEDIIENQKDTKKPLLILDQVSDPHNVGAILRSAAAFEAAAVILTKDNAPQETGVMAKSACGALELVPMVTVTNLRDTMNRLKDAGYWCIGLDGHAEQLMHQAKLPDRIALVLGAEGKGLRRLTRESCDMLVKLPISPQMESLNVSNAAAVALYVVRSL
jgi:23S rRNA (guanosine2251-2'-O)-methyltransferase